MHTPESTAFPFSLQDIVGWIMRRKDGTAIHYHLADPASIAQPKKVSTVVRGYLPSNTSGAKTVFSSNYKTYCEHEPSPGKVPELFYSKKDNIRLWIADSLGARRQWKTFDVAFDCGGVLDLETNFSSSIQGDQQFRSVLIPFSTATADKSAQVEPPKTRLVKIRWYDRQAPDLDPKAWPALLKALRAAAKDREEPLNVLTICQGGHGRSGSSAAALIMCMTDYSPLDVLTHVRALHCARAIESKIQHEYLNEVGIMLGREGNALEAEKVKSFKERFLTMTSKFAEPYKERVKNGKGAKVETREEWDY